MGIFDKAKQMFSGNPDKANQIVEKAGDIVEERTGGKYAEHVDRGQNVARDQLGVEHETPVDAPEPPPAPMDAPPAEGAQVQAPFEPPTAPEGVATPKQPTDDPFEGAPGQNPPA